MNDNDRYAIRLQLLLLPMRGLGILSSYYNHLKTIQSLNAIKVLQVINNVRKFRLEMLGLLSVVGTDHLEKWKKKEEKKEPLTLSARGLFSNVKE